jgi:hypothetical protein
MIMMMVIEIGNIMVSVIVMVVELIVLVILMKTAIV